MYSCIKEDLSIYCQAKETLNSLGVNEEQNHWSQQYPEKFKLPIITQTVRGDIQY